MYSGAYPIIGVPFTRADCHPHTSGEPGRDIEPRATQFQVDIDRIIVGRVTLWASAVPSDQWGLEFDLRPDDEHALALRIMEAAGRAGYDAPPATRSKGR